MSLWAILPTKSYDEIEAKTSRGSLEATLTFLRAIQKITTIVVMSPDPKVVAVAHQFNARTISIADLPAWETGLARALHLAAASGVWRAMILNPAFSTLDIQFFDHLLSLEQPPCSLSLVPLGDTDDTGIAIVSPPDYLHISLGSGSLRQNAKAARMISAPLAIHSVPDLLVASTP